MSAARRFRAVWHLYERPPFHAQADANPSVVQVCNRRLVPGKCKLVHACLSRRFSESMCLLVSTTVERRTDWDSAGTRQG